MRFFDSEFEDGFVHFFNQYHWAHDLFGLVMSLLLWVATLRRPDVWTLPQAVFTLASCAAVLLHLILLYALVFHGKLYSRLRQAAFIVQMNLNMYSVAITNTLIKKAVLKGASELVLLKFIVMSKWPFLLSNYFFFRLPVADAPISLFTSMVYMHMYAGLSYFDGDLDGLPWVHWATAGVNNVVQPLACGVARALASLEPSQGLPCSHPDDLRVTARQVVTAFWLISHSATFWGFYVFAYRRERGLRQTYIRSHGGSARRPIWSNMDQIWAMVCIQLYMMMTQLVPDFGMMWPAVPTLRGSELICPSDVVA